jgi:CheY-like chemotaxis protein
MNGRLLHALVVDDNYYNRDLLTLALSYRNIPATQADGGEQAIQLLQSESFDIVLLDLAMPIVSGQEVMSKIVDMGIRDDLVVVVITAHSHLADSVTEMADFVMYKPIDIEAFTQFLDRLQTVQA